MKLAIKAYLSTLILLAFAFSVSAQSVVDNDKRSERDPRNTAPTVGTGGPPGGPTGLFTVYDGQTLRAGEFTFSAAYSNFDRDPGDVDITEVPVSFQVGITNNVEVFFNTDAYRAVKVNSPRNLSGFYLPNSRVLGAAPAIILSPGLTAGPFFNTAIFRPGGVSPFVQFPYVSGSTGLNGPIFGFPAGTTAPISAQLSGGEGADNFPGIGSVYGSILPGVVLQSIGITSPTLEVPTSFTLAPTYLPDAPFVNRTYGESSFSTFTAGAKIRFTGINNPVGIGVIPFYRWYADRANDFSGFNQLQRGASAGGGSFNPFSSNRGDFGAIFFADARLRKWINVSGNIGYVYNSDVKSDFGLNEEDDDDLTLLDRPDELLAGIAVDFPVNRYFQPILEFRTTQYIGGRTPNAFENDPYDGLAGVRVFPARWLGFGFAYRYHFNQQSDDSFDDGDENESFAGTAFVTCTVASSLCTSRAVTNSFSGVPPGFRTSSDPHGFIVQAFIGRRDDRQGDVQNIPANVTAVTLGQAEVKLPCAPGTRPAEGETCSDNQTVSVSTTATDVENDVLTYNYTVSGGRVTGQGANVSWDLSGVTPGTYTITAGVDDGCGVCGQTQTKTITVSACSCVQECDCPTVTVTGPAGTSEPNSTITFTANVTGGSQTNVTYEWSVSSGTIESGQGTPSITVRAPDAAGNVVATVIIGGTDPTCQCTKEASETAIIAAPAGPELTDEFGQLPNDEVRGRLDALFAILGNNPNDQGYIINYGPARQVAARERLIQNHIRLRRFDASRITVVRGGDTGEIRTTFFRVPPGVTPPTPGQ